MITIWKKEIQTTDVQLVEMPLDAELLTVQEQNERVILWFKVDTEKPKANREIVIYGTGNPMPDNVNAVYLATYQVLDGRGVFHVFDNGYVTQ